MTEQEKPGPDELPSISEFLSKVPLFKEFPLSQLDLLADLIEIKQKNQVK